MNVQSDKLTLVLLFPKSRLNNKAPKGMEGTYKTLNFVGDSDSGIATIGNCHASQGRGEAVTGRKNPVLDEWSKEVIGLIETELRKTWRVRDSLFPFMRVSFIKGAKTVAHVDQIRGITDTHTLITRKIGAFELCVHLFPSFKCSVVSYEGREYIPMEYNEDIGLFMIGKDPTNDLRGRVHKFCAKVVYKLEPCGKLNVACVGIVGGLIRVLSLTSQPEMVHSPKDLPKVRFRDLVATCNRVETKPRIQWMFINKELQWYSFPSWRYRHFVRGDPRTERISVFFRVMREQMPPVKQCVNHSSRECG